METELTSSVQEEVAEKRTKDSLERAERERDEDEAKPRRTTRAGWCQGAESEFEQWQHQNGSDKKRQAEAEHPEDMEREHEKPLPKGRRGRRHTMRNMRKHGVGDRGGVG